MSGSLLSYALGRMATVVGVSVAASALTFLTLHGLYPEAFGDTRPLLVELRHFLERTFLRADLGASADPPFDPVLPLIARGLPADLSLVAGAMAFGVALGAAAGAAAAKRPRSLLARGLDGAGLLALCAPVYVVGLAVILLFGQEVGAPLPTPLVATNAYVPLTEDPLRWLRALVVPWVVCGLPLAAMTLRATQVNASETLRADFTRTAAAKGLRPLAITARHTLPVTMAPVLSLASAYVPLMVGNALLVEKVFGVPGAFALIPDALDVGDYPVIQGLVIVSAVLVVAASAIADVILAAFDPRIRGR